MQIYSKTDIGLVRDSNQDACRYGILDNDCAWAVVCDGMGGQNGGNVASRLAVEYISDSIQNKYVDDMSDKELSNLLIEISQDANKLVYEKSCNELELSGMGTTLELAFIRHNLLYLLHVGDSRAYLMRKNRIIQVTKDHSLVQEMIESGEITKEQAKSHPNKNLITRALGVSGDLKLDFIEAPLASGDILILATDGLTNYAGENDILNIINEGDIADACDHLVDKAKSGGGGDNITVALILL